MRVLGFFIPEEMKLVKGIKILLKNLPLSCGIHRKDLAEGTKKVGGESKEEWKQKWE